MTRIKARWRGDPDWGFTATGEYDGTPDATTAGVLACLVDEVAYGDAEAAATPLAVASVVGVGDAVQVLFVTWHPEIGAASVRVDLHHTRPDVG